MIKKLLNIIIVFLKYIFYYLLPKAAPLGWGILPFQGENQFAFHYSLFIAFVNPLCAFLGEPSGG